jgi:hypothetical protein
MKKIVLFSLFASNIFAQSVIIRPNKVESQQNAAIDNIILQSSNQPNIIGKRHNGTTASPTNVDVDNDLLSLQAAGYAGGTFTGVRAAIRLEATQNWTINNNGSRIKFLNTPNGSTNLTERMVINQNGNVGIGVSLPDYKLEILQETSSDRGIGIYRFGGDAPTFFGISARGNATTPTKTFDGDILSRFGGKGHNETGFTSATARIDMVANENWSPTATGTDIKFYATWAGQTSVEEKMIIRGSGNVGINKTDPESKLTVNGDFQLIPEKFVHDNDINLIALNRNGKSVIRFGGNGKVDLKGIAGGVDGMILHIYSIRGANPVLGNNKIVEIHDDSPDANLVNRILTGEPYVGVNGVGQNLTISNEGGATLIYDGTVNRWRVIGIQR